MPLCINHPKQGILRIQIQKGRLHEKMKRFGGFYSGLLKERRATGALLLIFAFSLISSALHFLLLGNTKNGAVALLLLLILLLIPPLEKGLKLCIPTLGYALLIFLIGGSLLGSCYDFYFKIS